VACTRSPRHYPSFSHYTPPTDTSPLSLHDALPIWAEALQRSPPAGGDRQPDAASGAASGARRRACGAHASCPVKPPVAPFAGCRSEEHTSELQSRENLVCRLLLEKKKTKNKHRSIR